MPKAGPGREARLEKKKMMAQKRRDREISPGIQVRISFCMIFLNFIDVIIINFAEMAESTLMGPT